MGGASGSGQRSRVIAGRVSGRCCGRCGRRVHGRGRVMRWHIDRRSAHIQPSASSRRLMHIPPAGAVHSGRRFLFDVLLELPSLLVRMMGRPRVHVRRLMRMAEVQIPSVRTSRCSSHSGSLVVAGHAQSRSRCGAQARYSRRVAVCRRGAGLSLARLSVLNAVELAAVVVIVVVVEASARCRRGGQRVVSARSCRRRAGCVRVVTSG